MAQLNFWSLVSICLCLCLVKYGTSVDLTSVRDAVQENAESNVRDPMVLIDACVDTCGAGLPLNVSEFLREVFQIQGRVNQTRFPKFFNETMLREYCTFAENRLNCIDTCATGNFKKASKNVFQAATFMCTESNFLDNVACYRQIFESDRGYCDEHIGCAQHATKLNLALQSDMNYTSTAENVVSSGCDYISCGNICLKERITGLCGEQQAKVLAQFSQKLVDGIKAYISLVYSDELQYSPTCTTIGNSL